MFTHTKPFKKTFVMIAIFVVAILLTSCAPTLAQNSPTSQPVSQPTPVVVNDQMNAVLSAASFALANQLQLGEDAIELVAIQPTQWPDGCLGVPQPGMMCAMHVVDGYKITLSANGQTNEVRTNQDGSQLVLAEGTTPATAGVSYTLRNGDGCQNFLIADNGVAYGSCDGKLAQTPFVETSRAAELDHFLTTFSTVSLDLPEGSVDLIGTGGTTPSADQQRSISVWAKLVAEETQAGRSSAASELVIGWHREGGLAGFCDDLMVYATGIVRASSCKNGQANDLGESWLDNDQLTQLYQWLDGLNRFEYAPQTEAAADAMTITLDFAGQGTASATEADQKTIESFAENIFSQESGMGAVPSPTDTKN